MAAPAAAATATTKKADPPKEEPKKADTGATPKDNASYPGVPPGVVPLGVAKALFDYAATEDGELTFKGNDLITILQKDPSGTNVALTRFASLTCICRLVARRAQWQDWRVP